MKLPYNKMLKYGNKEFRNLEEQVRQNKDDIARHYAQDRVLADFGIKVVGQVDTPEELPDPATYEGDYGNAYAVGEAAPFTYYIWTRANNISPTDYWFDFGEITVAGPQGPKGDTVVGPQGTPGGKWYYGSSAPTASSTYNEGDMYLVTLNNAVYRYNGTRWNYASSIQGRTGAPGPKGDDAGTIQIASIRGIVPNQEVLASIDPTTLPIGTVYLVGSAVPYDVYLPINGMWQNIGQFNAGTLVKDNATPLSTLNIANYISIDGNNGVPYISDEDDSIQYMPLVQSLLLPPGDEWVPPVQPSSRCIVTTDDNGILPGPEDYDLMYTYSEEGYNNFLPSLQFISELAGGVTTPIDVRLEIFAPTTSQGDEIHLNFTAFMEDYNWRIMLPEETYTSGFEINTNNFKDLWRSYLSKLVGPYNYQGDIYLSNVSGYVMTQGGAQPIVDVYFDVSDLANPTMTVFYIEREVLQSMEVMYEFGDSTLRDIDAYLYTRKRVNITFNTP